MDKLAIEEALQLYNQDPSDRTAAVVSVPAGAPGFTANSNTRGKERKLKYVRVVCQYMQSAFAAAWCIIMPMKCTSALSTTLNL